MMKKIGIVGYGKMGKEIFDFYYPKCKTSEFVIYVRSSIEEHEQGLSKDLSKMLKRKRLTEEEYQYLSEHIRFTDDLTQFAGCDLVIESIVENLSVKQDIFEKLSKIVSKECLLTTNTSSLNIGEVFCHVAEKERCFGLHYFYPLKLTGFVEMNLIPENSEANIEKAKNWVEENGKQVLKLLEPYHIYLNQYIFTCVCTGMLLWDQSDKTISEWEDSISAYFPIGGVFGLVDSIGMKLLSGNVDHFGLERTRNLYTFGKEKMNAWKLAGCPEEPNTFLEFMKAPENQKLATGSGTEQINEDGQKLISVIMNEAVCALEECHTDKNSFLQALVDTAGTAENFTYYYEKIGYETMKEYVNELAEKKAGLIQKIQPKEVLDQYFLQV